MARGRARGAQPEPEVVEQEDDQMQDAQDAELNVLKDPITWRPGKTIPVGELLRRLKALAKHLQETDQETSDRSSLVPKAQELANVQLLGHKDRGVKAFTMVCIVEMFRLLAPNAPYKGGQLKEIFSVFASTIIPSLADPADSYNHENNAIVVSLTNYKSIVLITDLAGSDHLLLTLFTNAFDVLAGGGKGATEEKLPKNLEYNLTNLLCTVADECEVIPTGVVDVVLAQFLRTDPNALAPSSKKPETGDTTVLEPPAAYNMARAICNTCSEKFERAIFQYFTSVLGDISQSVAGAKNGKPKGKKHTNDDSDDESDDGMPSMLAPPAESDVEEGEKAHRLLRELWRSCPDVIQNIVPLIESEAMTDNSWLRTMAVQTFGDMVSGIGAAGPPPSIPLDPLAYPSQSLDDGLLSRETQNPILTPNAPHAFSAVYPSAYNAFAGRAGDKAPSVRAAWATAAGRVLLTSGGGKGLDHDLEKTLLQHLSTLLVDADAGVRLAAVQAVASFDFASIVQKIGRSGTVVTPGSVLCHLADRIKDTKPLVRSAATELLARIWGVASGAMVEGNERIRDLFGAIPSKIFDAWYVNTPEIHALVHRVLFDYLLPIGFPPIKPKQQSGNQSQRVEDSQVAVSSALNPDTIRVERILVLVRDLDDRAKQVFFAQQVRREGFGKYLERFLKLWEDANSKADTKDKEAKKNLDKLTDAIVKTLDIVPDPAVATEHLNKFAKHHDRRSYQLIRFCFSPESDYRKIVNAMKELTKRIDGGPTGMSDVLQTITPMVRAAAVLVYNKSHVPAIVEFSRTDEKGLASAAHEVLKEISSRAPQIFKVHLHELCEALKKNTPSSGQAHDEGVVDTLKACAGFARRFPDGMPKDRDFYKAMVDYSIRGTPPKTAKHAITVIVSSSDKKDMYIKEVQRACIKDFKYGEENFLSKLASISQLRRLANHQCEDQTEAIMEIAIGQVLGQVRETADEADPDWVEDIDAELAAKLWALRILVNGLRGFNPSQSDDPTTALQQVADPVYKLLNTLVQKDGELSKTSSTPKSHRAHLQLAAAVQLLKLSCNRSFDPLLTPADFNQLSRVVQHECPQVRAGFARALMKYLGTGLNGRFYSLIFLYAYEPDRRSKEQTVTWLRSRATLLARNKENTIEASFPRFLSLLAHHQDFSKQTEHLEDFVLYIVFYLRNVATVANLPLIYHFVQRLKTVQDGIDPDKSENLYVLSDIAEAVIRIYQEVQGWSLQVMSGKVNLPSTLFSKLPSHSAAQEIADRRYIPDELAEELEDLVKKSLKTKKRKLEGTSAPAAKKHKSSAASGVLKKVAVKKAPRPSKTPKKMREEEIPSSGLRKSSRRSNAKSYAENDDSEDDDEMMHWQEGQDGGEEDVEMGDEAPADGEANKENLASTPEGQEEKESSTPPTSNPTHLTSSAVKATEKKDKKPTGKRKAAATSSKVEDKASTRATRTTRTTRAKERDIMDIPSDSE